MGTIPASAVVNVTPNVIAAGGSAIDLVGLLLTDDTRVPIGAVQPFADASEVGDYFGASSTEKALATIYFNGFANSTVKPGKILFAQYPTASVAAFLRGGNISTLTLAQLNAFSGTLSVTIDGSLKTASINLAAATAFSNAAQLIASALGIHGAAAAAITGSISGDTLTVSAVSSGTLSVGQVLGGTGVTANTYIAAALSGTGGTGTYTVSPSQNSASQTITVYAPAVVYDSVSGAFVLSSGSVGTGSTISFGSGALATDLLLTSITGAVVSQGAVAAVPGTFMDAVVAQTQDWVSFMTVFDPDASGNANKLLFSAWTAAQNNRYVYVAWDTDLSPSVTVPATASLGYLIAQAAYSGTCLVGQDVADADLVEVAAFVCGFGASVDFGEPNGRATLAFKSQSGLTATCTDESTADKLIANGYNFYGAYATANDSFVFLYPGSISGAFLWFDSFVNEVWLNNALQLALMDFLTQAKSVPYNLAGYGAIEAACAGPINAALSFGEIRAGVKISNTLNQRGWYLQVLDASPTVRAARGSPPCTLWYMDGQSVQQINLTSVELQ